MNSLKGLFLALLVLLGATAQTALAQQSPTSTWNDSVTWRSGIDRSVDIQRAEAQERARRGGHGAAQIVTTYEGEVTFNEANEYNGAVTNNSATTATNLNSFSSSIKQDNGSSATVTFTTGNVATNTSQNATATSAQTGTGNASNTNTSSNDD